MSAEFKTTLISGGISLLLSIIAAIVTSKITLKQEKKKKIHERREQIYIKCFDLFQSVKDHPYLVFNNKNFFAPLQALRTELNLFASQEVLNVLEPFYANAKKTIEEYWSLFDGEEYEMQKSASMEYDGLTEIDFQREEENYMESHLISQTDIDKIFADLVNAMRKDIGTR